MNPKKPNEKDTLFFPVANVDVSKEAAEINKRYAHIGGKPALGDSASRAPTTSETPKSKPASSLSEFLDDDEPSGKSMDAHMIEWIMKWDEDAREVPASKIRKAMLYHMFFNQSDRWWKENLTANMVRRRAEDMVAAMPEKWKPGYFLVGNPECPACFGTNQIEYTKDETVYIKGCLCARKVLRVDATRKLLLEYNNSKFWDKNSLPDRKKIFRKLGEFFM